VSAGCAGCTTAMAACGVASCFTPCAVGGGFSSAECIACVASSCGATFLTCAGRTL